MSILAYYSLTVDAVPVYPPLLEVPPYPTLPYPMPQLGKVTKCSAWAESGNVIKPLGGAVLPATSIFAFKKRVTANILPSWVMQALPCMYVA